jgi:hypothetical protein
MKLKSLLLILALGIFPSFALSYSCPIKMGNVGKAISGLDSTKYEAIIEAVQMLKTKDEKPTRMVITNYQKTFLRPL